MYLVQHYQWINQLRITKRCYHHVMLIKRYFAEPLLSLEKAVRIPAAEQGSVDFGKVLHWFNLAISCPYVAMHGALSLIKTP